MNFSSDGEILDLFKSKLVTYTKTGKPSYTRANNAMKFYSLIRQIGLKATKELYNERTFYDALKHLENCEISMGHLQNLAKNPNGKVIPFVRLFELKMAEQLPHDYVQPISSYSPKKQGLYLVA